MEIGGNFGPRRRSCATRLRGRSVASDEYYITSSSADFPYGTRIARIDRKILCRNVLTCSLELLVVSCGLGGEHLNAMAGGVRARRGVRRVRVDYAWHDRTGADPVGAGGSRGAHLDGASLHDAVHAPVQPQ